MWSVQCGRRSFSVGVCELGCVMGVGGGILCVAVCAGVGARRAIFEL
jgi:hypothetical protein